MSHVTGVITGLFDNRLKNGQPSPFPNWKIMIGDNEFTAWTANNLPCKKGDNVSIQFGVSKKTGKPFVSSDYETKELKLQVIPAGQATTTPIVPSDEIPLDDNLSNYVPDDFANNGVVDNSPTSFPYGANAKKSVDSKSLEIFTIAMAKSALESNQLKADKTSIANFIKDMVEVYKQSY
jgi:hypothetical protein